MNTSPDPIDNSRFEEPFLGVDGDLCYTTLDIAREVTRHADYYCRELRNWNSPLYKFFETKGINLAAKYQRLFKSAPWTALWRLAYEICPECEFPIWSNRINDVVWCSTISRLVEEYAASGPDSYSAYNPRTPIGRYTPFLITDECFITWLKARDKVLAQLIEQALAKEKAHSADMYIYVFYLLDRERNYFYKNDTENFYTLAHIGEMLNQDMVDYWVCGRNDDNRNFYPEQHKRLSQLANIGETKLYYYLKSRGYVGSLDYIDWCFDINSPEHQKKAAPYNSKLAAMKVCQALACQTFYYFPKSATLIIDQSELDKVPIEEQKYELYNGFLLEWLAVHYQEHPSLDQADDERYQRRTLDFMQHLTEIDPNHPQAIRFRESHEEVERNASVLHKLIAKINRKKGTLMAFAAMIVLMIALMLVYGVRNIPNDDDFVYYWRNMLYIALPIFVIMMIPAVQNFISKVTYGILGSPLLFALFVANIVVVGWEVLCLYIVPYSNVSMPILYGVFALWILYKCFIGNKLHKNKHAACINPNFEAAYVEPLLFTWRDTNDPYKEFQSSVFREAKEYESFLKGAARKLNVSIRTFAVWMVLLIAGFCFISVPVSSFISKILPKNNIIAQYDDEDKVDLYICQVESGLTIRQKPDNASRQLGTLSDGEIIEVVGFTGKYAKILYGDGIAYVLKEYIVPLE